MSVRWRFLLVAVALPAVGLFGLAILMGSIHASHLEADLDQRLLAEAALEGESLFDGEDWPHRHVADAQGPSGTVAARAIYRPDGTLFMHQPRDVAVPRTLVWHGPRDFVAGKRSKDFAFSVGPLPHSRLRASLGALFANEFGGARVETVRGESPPWNGAAVGGDERCVVVRVRDAVGATWFLRLTTPLAPLEAIAEEFRWTSLAIAAAMVLLLATLAWPLSRRVFRGVERLVTETLPHLVEHGPAPLVRVRERDEIDVLHNAIADAAERLAQAEDARGRVLAHAAHELRTPLSLMRTEIDLALRRERSTDELRGALAGLRAEVDRLSALATGLLDLERLRFPTAFAARPIALEAVCGEAIARFRAGAPTVTLTATIEPGVVVNGDTQMIRMALDNLIGNAVKHSPAGGTVDVRVARDGNVARIRVEDEGPGVPEAERTRIFEPFYRAPDAPQGTGLGLAIVSQIAALHRGRVRVGTGTLRGASFVLELAIG